MVWQLSHYHGKPRRDSRRRAVVRTLGAVPVTALMVFALAACAPEPGAPPAAETDTTSQESAAESAAESSAPAESTDDAPADPAPAAEKPAAPTDCGWATSALAADLGAIPTGQEGDLAQVLPGSWQHVAYDEGAGYTDDLTADIRYVFPSTSELIYCQDVPGITDQAENRAAVQLDGTEIVLPAPATGYAVQSWSENAMVWVNHRDGSLYLLQRR